MKYGISNKLTKVLLAFVTVLTLSIVFSLTAFAADVSGTVYASALTDNSELVLKADTTLKADKNITFKSISGDYELFIEGSGSVTVSGSVNVKFLSVDETPFTVNGTINVSDWLYAGTDYLHVNGGIIAENLVRISSNNAFINGTEYGIYSKSGNIELNGSGGTLGINVTAYERPLLAHSGSIYLIGDITCVSSRESRYCIDAGQSILDNSGLYLNLTLKGSHGMIAQKGNISLHGNDIDIQTETGFAVLAKEGSVTLSAKNLAAICDGTDKGEMEYPYGVSAKGDVHLTATDIASIYGLDYGVISHEGSVTLDGGGYYYIGASGNDDTETCMGIYANNDIVMDGEFRIISDYGPVIFADNGAITIEGSLEGDGPEKPNQDWSSYYEYMVISEKEFSFIGSTLELTGIGGIKSGAFVYITAESTSIITEECSPIEGGHFTENADEQYVYVDSDSLWLENKDTEEDYWANSGISAEDDITVYTQNAGIVGLGYGLYSSGGDVYIDGDTVAIGAIPLDESETCTGIRAENGNVDLIGDITIIAEKGCGIYTAYGSEDGVSVTGSLKLTCGGYSNYTCAVWSPNGFYFSGTKLEATGNRGITSKDVYIEADYTSISVDKYSAIDAAQSFSRGDVYIDSDYLWLETNGNVNDPLAWQDGIAAKGNVTVYSDNATIIGYNGICAQNSESGNGILGDVYLYGNFAIASIKPGTAIYGNDVTAQGTLTVQGYEKYDPVYKGQTAIRANNFVFQGTKLDVKGFSAIRTWEEMYIDATEASLIATEGFVLWSDYVSVYCDDLWIEGQASKNDDLRIPYGVEGDISANIVSENGTILSYNHAVYSPSGSTTLIGNITVVSSNGSAVKIDEGDCASFNGKINLVSHSADAISAPQVSMSGNITVSSTKKGIDASEVYFDGDRLNVSSAGNCIHATNAVDLDGLDIRLTNTETRSSAISCEGTVTLGGEIVIDTNGWYGIYAEDNIMFEEGYYKMTGAGRDIPAVRTVNGKIIADPDLFVKYPANGSFGSKEVLNAAANPAEEIEIITPITKVDILVETPTDGNYPHWNYRAVYGLGDDLGLESIIWYENGEKMDEEAVFAGGNNYSVELIVNTKNYHRFADSITASVNGKTPSIGSYSDGKHVRLSLSIGTCPIGIGNVELTIKAPVEGNTPSKGVTSPAGAHYGVYSSDVRWMVSADGVSYTSMGASEKFVDGKYYAVYMDVNLSNKSYAFNVTSASGSLQPNVSATVNGGKAKTSKAYDQDPAETFTVYYEFGVCNDYIIERIDVIDVVPPVAGEHPTYKANVAGTGYYINTSKNSYYDDWMNDRKLYYVKNGVSWWDVTDGGYEYVYENEVFLPGHKYRCEVYVYTESGYEFVKDLYTVPETWPTATVNGYSAALTFDSGSGLEFEQEIKYDFDCQPKSVSTVIIYGIDKPTAGNTPDFSPIVAYPEYYRLDPNYGVNNSGMYWYDSEGNMLESTDSFEAEKEYRIELKLIPVQVNGMNMCKFTSPASASVNDAEVIDDPYWDGVSASNNKVYVYYTFVPEKEIPKVGVTVSGAISGFVSTEDTITVRLYSAGLPEAAYETIAKCSAGYYAITNVLPGTYTLKATSDKYETVTATVTVGETSIIHSISVKVILKIAAASLSLQENISINFKVAGEAFTVHGFTKPYLVVTVNGEETVLNTWTIEQATGRYVFKFNRIAPNMIGDSVDAVVYAYAPNGNLIESKTINYGVKTYCQSQLKKSIADSFRTVIVDLLNYGAAAQNYTGYKTNDLANAFLQEDEYKSNLAYATKTLDLSSFNGVAKSNYETVANPKVQMHGANLALSDSVTIRFIVSVLNVSDFNGLKIQISKADGSYTWEFDATDESVVEFYKAQDGRQRYYVRFKELNATEMSDVIYLKFVDSNGNPVSNTLRYSIGCYAYSKQNDTTTPGLAEMVKAMMKYGNATKAWNS